MNRRINPEPRGMTLIEVLISSAMFTMLIMVSFSAVQSLRAFTTTNVTQIDLQEHARHALEFITLRLRNGGRFTDSAAVPPRPYPCLFKSDATFPAGYHAAAQHGPKFDPRAKPGTSVGGGDPTLPSDEIIYRIPGDADGNGLPTKINAANLVEIEWSPVEYSFVVAPGPDNQNQIECRDSTGNVEIVLKHVDRMQIQDYTTDPSLTTRQLRITLYVTKLIPLQGVISSNDPALATQILTVAVSTIVDLRNTADLD